jgi:Transposase DDE domain
LQLQTRLDGMKNAWLFWIMICGHTSNQEQAMRHPHYTITARDVQRHAAPICRTHLKLRDHGPKCRAAVLFAILCYAAARIGSIALACGALRDAPSDQAVRDALLAMLPETHELQRRINRALAGDLPKALRRRRQQLAIDLILVPYHGQPLQEESEVYRSQPKCGTSHFHAYATVYVVRKGQRFTLALTFVTKGEAMDAIVKRLLRQASKTGVKPRRLLLDRGFYSVDVMRYLQAARVPFLMPAVIRGRKADHRRGPSGTRVFHLRKSSGWSQYTLRNARGRTATVSICIKCSNARGQSNKRGRRTWVYAYWGLQPSSYAWVAETYRLRFGIESSYRQLHQARIRTCTRQPRLRMLYVGIALILRNVWVWLHWEALAHHRRGGRVVDTDQLPFRAMLLWLQHLAEALLGVRDWVAAENPLPT